MNQSFTQQIKQEALALGFNAVGISTVENLSAEKAFLDDWLNKDFHGEMGYLARNQAMRADPTLLSEGAKSVVSVLINYYPKQNLHPQSHYKMAKYSLGSDYHFVIKEKLKPLMALISEQFPAVKMRVFTDSAPVFDKSWAIKAGLGWMGKNTLLLNKNLGSFFVIGEILLDIELQPDTPLEKEYCGNCTRCIDACPTQALIAPYQMDARRCISYLTIESKTAIPEEFHSLLNDWIFGCDICQDVCPWNNRAKPHNEPAFDLSADLLLMKKEDWENLEKPDFKRLFKSSPQMRSGYERFKMLIDLQKD